MNAPSERRPEGERQVALICGHGEGGGLARARLVRQQQVFLLAEALEQLGYRPTIFFHGAYGRNGEEDFPQAEAQFGAAVKTVTIPAAAGRSARGDDFSFCLEKIAEWLEAYIADEAARRGCSPWRCYEFINSHHWDAGLLAERLMFRWRARVVAQAAERLVSGVVPAQLLEQVSRNCCRLGLGEAPAFFLGKLMLESEGSPATPLLQRARMAAVKFSRLREGEGGTKADQLMGAVASALAEARHYSVPTLHELVAAEALGEAVLELSPQVSLWLDEEFEMIDRHLWTPCSLATQEEEHQSERAAASQRRRRLEDRKSHEQAICDHTNAFMVTSLEVAEHLLSHYHVPCEQMFYFSTCVDRAIFRTRTEGELEEVLEFLAGSGGLGLEQLRESKVVLEYGPAEPSQHKELVLDAFSFVLRESPDALLVMLCSPEGKLAGELKARRDSRSELRSRVIFIDHPPPALVGPLFSLADILVSAAERERDGVNLLQAAACGTALVCSDRIPVAVHHLQPEAVLVPSGEVFDFARAILDLLDDEDSRRQRGEQLSKKAADFDWKTQTRAMLQYLVRRGFQVAPPD